MKGKILFGCVFLPLFSHSVNAEWVEWIADTQFDYTYNDNLNQSGFTADELDDHLFDLSLTGGRYFQISQDNADYTRLRLAVDANFRAHDQFDDLDHIRVGGSFALLHKFGLGRDAIRASLYSRAHYQWASLSERNLASYDFGISVTKNFTERLNLLLDFGYKIDDGRNAVQASPAIFSDVYDAEKFVVTLGSGFLITNNFQATLDYNYANGDLLGNCTVANVGKVFSRVDVNAFAKDRVFGGCQYRFDGDVHTVSLGGNYAINNHAFVHLGGSYSRGGDNNLIYETFQVNANIRYEF